MRFMLPDGRPFEIADESWTETGMNSFERGTDVAYRGRYQPTMRLFSIAHIELPSMTGRLHKGTFGLEPSRMVKVLREIARREEIWPVEIIESESRNYRLKHGAHRYHASIAAGFSHIPAIVVLP
jgi:hypothetical protein